jgi:hypothetical protein
MKRLAYIYSVMDTYLLVFAGTQMLATGCILYSVQYVPYDFYHTTVNSFIRTPDNQTVVDYLHPVAVQMVYNTNLGECILLCALCIGTFAVITRAMLVGYHENGNSEALDGAFSSDNSEIAESPSMLLWNFSFACLIALSHFIYFATTITPCSSEYLVLCSLLTTVPLVLICMPRPCKPTSDYGNAKPVLLCGIPNHLLHLVAYLSGALWITVAIRYDPTGCRFQFLVLVIAVDLLVLGVGHLWDHPPAIRTVVNCRILYVGFISTSLLVLMYAQHLFPTRYASKNS